MRRLLLLLALVPACGDNQAASSCPDHWSTHGGLVLSFDDAHLADWTAALPHFAAHDAHATFFLTRTAEYSDAGWREVDQLAAAGHEIAAHTEHHPSAFAYCDSRTACPPPDVARYLADEIDDQLADFAAHGYHPVDFAFPFGQSTPPLVAALAPTFRHERDITGAGPGKLLDADAAFLPVDHPPLLIGAIDLDVKGDHSDGEYEVALERAFCADETLVTYGHDLVESAPAGDDEVTLLSRIDALLERADELDLPVRRLSDLRPAP